MGKRGPIESLESGDHVGAFGLAGDLAVAEKSPARVASAVREKSQCHPPSLLFFYSNLDFWLSCKKSYLLFLKSKNCETNFVVFLEMPSF